jgi:hypothetical protein
MMMFIFEFVVLGVMIVVLVRLAGFAMYRELGGPMSLELTPLYVLISIVFIMAFALEQIGGVRLLIPAVIVAVILGGLLLLKTEAPRIPLRGACPHFPGGFPEWVTFCPDCKQPVEREG